jgi:hypothetical protein
VRSFLSYSRPTFYTLSILKPDYKRGQYKIDGENTFLEDNENSGKKQETVK